MKAKDRIYISDWQEMKPYQSHSSIDLYYLSICNEISKELDYVKKKDLVIPTNKFKDFVCFIVSYFEDVISETNLFATFRKKHSELYGKKLPFYEVDEEDYFENEINYEDIKFLIWYFANACQDDDVLNTESVFIDLMAGDIFEIFENYFETAPENPKLKEAYKLDLTDDFYEIRGFIQKILMGSYLFYPDISYKYMDELNELAEEHKKSNNFEQYFNELNDSFSLKTHTNLLSFKANQWAAYLLGEDHPNYEAILSIENRISGFFVIDEIINNYYVIEHIASKEKINLLQESFDYVVKGKNLDSIFYMSAVNFCNQWWFSGTCSIYDFDEEIINKIEEDPSFKSTFNFLPKNEQQMREVLNVQLSVFNTFNDNKLIKHLQGAELNSFMNNFYTQYNKKLNPKHKENSNITNQFDFDDDEPITVFFNVKSGIEIAYNVPLAFPITNPIQGEIEEIKDDFYTMIVAETISTEFAMEAYSQMLASNLNEFKDDFVFRDFDFLLRFYKTKHYFTKPSITLV